MVHQKTLSTIKKNDSPFTNPRLRALATLTTDQLYQILMDRINTVLRIIEKQGASDGHEK
jgi:hypothetical protein